MHGERELKYMQWQGNQEVSYAWGHALLNSSISKVEKCYSKIPKRFPWVPVIVLCFQLKKRMRKMTKIKKRSKHYEKRRKRKWYSLSMCQARWCVTCQSQWRLPASPYLFILTHHAITPSPSSAIALFHVSSLLCSCSTLSCLLFYFPSHILCSFTHTLTHRDCKSSWVNTL